MAQRHLILRDGNLTSQITGDRFNLEYPLLLANSLIFALIWEKLCWMGYFLISSSSVKNLETLPLEQIF